MAHVKETKTTNTNTRNNLDTTNQAAAARQTTTTDQRFSMIQTAAYLRAEKRSFQGGNPVQDWIDAEREIDAILKGTSRNAHA